MLGGISCSKRTIEQAAGDICSSISIHFADEAAVSAVTAFCTIDGNATAAILDSNGGSTIDIAYQTTGKLLVGCDGTRYMQILNDGVINISERGGYFCRRIVVDG